MAMIYLQGIGEIPPPPPPETWWQKLLRERQGEPAPQLPSPTYGTYADPWSVTPALAPPPKPPSTVSPVTTPPSQVVCTQEAMVCPDGSSVGRTGPNCEFAPCPTVAWEGIPDEWWNTNLLSFPPWVYLVGAGGVLWLLTRK